MMKKIEIVMIYPKYLGYTILELSKLFMYGTSYDVLQTYFRQQNKQLPYMDTFGFHLCVTSKDSTKKLKNLEDQFDSGNFKKQRLYLVMKIKKCLGNLE